MCHDNELETVHQIQESQTKMKQQRLHEEKEIFHPHYDPKTTA